ncbi:hypothetical protein SCE1572_39830 [Sorangium cellulosum So0157-2]|uniref:Uncharacterized protein n=1 Tax=Sorangium cellulosum So0157-2 TaxID=1254432 RepID=S4Y6P6_SORCE|nr:hypothetical protein SCE1572_39830 [Sorangium cellulosum So0157-2]
MLFISRLPRRTVRREASALGAAAAAGEACSLALASRPRRSTFRTV